MNSLWFLVAAAGVGRRMQADRPKQYLPLGSSTVLASTLARLDAFAEQCPLAGRMLVIAADDPYFASMQLDFSHWQTVSGGAERWQSVASGLQAIVGQDPEAWVMVHDAARPLVPLADLHALWQQCSQSQQGAILARPLVDTIKQVSVEGLATLDRSTLWAALTPQCFPAKRLLAALAAAQAQLLTITDEASAMEAAGEPVQLVTGSALNIKITTQADLLYAAWVQAQEEDR